jgi:hypothetical protein
MNTSDMSVRTARFAAALLGASLIGVLAAPLAGAQQDPYGSTTTTTQPGGQVGEVEASCSLTISQGKPGDEVTATVAGVFFGEKVRIRFDGTQVGETTAPAAPVEPAAVSTPVAFGGQALPAQQTIATTSVKVKFTVPKAAAVGTHIVTAVGDTFTCLCNPRGEFKVLAASTGNLARTGVQVAAVLAVAAALLLVGRTSLGASRRRLSTVGR